LRRHDPNVDPPTGATLSALTADVSTPALVALASWVEAFEPEPLELFGVLRPAWQEGQKLPDALRNAVSSRALGWSPEEKANLLDSITPSYTEGEVHDSVVRAAGLAEAGSER